MGCAFIWGVIGSEGVDSGNQGDERMLFHVTHHHDESTCPAHDFFFVVDADDVAQIFTGMFPIVSAGSAKVQPVGDYVAMMKMREQMNK
ncbi:MAG: hypothetical protein MAG471_01410 [Acidimicrobiaceae bacterium]|nr:hypothetical protein [Acidimicrobiaceae bacterium]